MIPLWAGILLLFGLMMTRQELCAGLIGKGLFLSGRKLLPSVFPYMVFSSILSKTGMPLVFRGKWAKKIASLLNLSTECVPVLVMGLVAGFPTGALMASEVYLSGGCSKGQAERLSALCNFCAPPFLLGAFGQGGMGNFRYGLILFLCQTAAVFLYGLACGRISKKKGGAAENIYFGGPVKREELQEKDVNAPFSVIGKCVALGAVKSVQVVGYVLFFSLLSGVIYSVFPSFLGKNTLVKALFFGFFEFSSGVFALEGAPLLKLFFGSLLICFSGLSVHMQVAGFLNEGRLSSFAHLKAHFFLAPVVAVATVLVSKIFCLI